MFVLTKLDISSLAAIQLHTLLALVEVTSVFRKGYVVWLLGIHTAYVTRGSP